MKYKVSYRGFAYVEANDSLKAEEKVMYDEDAIYDEKECISVEEVEEFVVRLED